MIVMLLATMTAIGLAGLLPRPDGRSWFGVRVFCAFNLLLLFLYSANLVTGVSLHLLAYIAVIGALVGGVRLAALEFRCDLALWLHPVMVLPATFAGAIAVWGLDYQPMAWDEFVNWLSWARQITNTGRFVGAGIAHGAMGYTPGWALVLAFPNLLLGGTFEIHASVMPFVMHAAFCGLVYDVACHLYQHRRGGNAPEAGLVAWIIVLGLLAVEASWKLVPTHLLIEEPQSYGLAACFLLLLAGLRGVLDWRRGCIFTALILAGGYIIKIPILALAGPLALAWAWIGLRQRHQIGWTGLIVHMAALAAPVSAAYLLWRLTGKPESCISDPMAMLGGASLEMERALDLAKRMSRYVGEYLLGYKFFLTGIGLVGLAIVAASRRIYPLVICLALYLAIYFGSLYVYHLYCFGEYYFLNLNSPDRFTRVPLRVIHIVGTLVVGVEALAVLAGHLRPNRYKAAGFALVALLAGWQVRQMERSLQSMASRFDATPGWLGEVRLFRREADLLVKVWEGLPADLQARPVRLIYQGSDGYFRIVIDYYTLGKIKFASDFSYGETPKNHWMRQVSTSDMSAILLDDSVIWPVFLDGWMTGVMSRLMVKSTCGAALTTQFLLPDKASGKLVCHRKDG
ncbi:MAG: hypothetical protein EPN20_09355 [Magnetospirillum sp.]|nr:MAG: hypothetical protein EPN20_09355 [Magnetospirillum sp.]